MSPFKPLGPKEIIPVIGSSNRTDYNQPLFNQETSMSAGTFNYSSDSIQPTMNNYTPSITRCKRCRIYINPYVDFIDQTHWRCNVCGLVSEVPNHFDYDIQKQCYVDRFERPELKYACVEFVAPPDYMIRPPQPQIFCFVIDMTSPDVLQTFSKCLMSVLDDIPDDDCRVKLSFLLVGSKVHFFCLEEAGVKEYVVSDLDDIFLPVPHDLVVNLSERKSIIEELLRAFGVYFTDNPPGNEVALGSGLQAAFKLMSGIGGKIVVLLSRLPNKGLGELKPRESNGADKVDSLQQPQSSFYKGFAIDCSRVQICVDFFLFGSNYFDLATLTGASRYTGGVTYHYPDFVNGDVSFAMEFAEYMRQSYGMEAVLRVRASRGIRADAFHGNFFVRGSDLLALPSVNPHSSYAFQFTIEENLATSGTPPVGFCFFQSALLHTTNFGERRIRVLSTVVKVSDNITECFRSVDQYALMTLLTKMAIERSLSARLEDAMDAVLNKVLDIFQTQKSLGVSGLQIVDNLSNIPILAFALTKNLLFRGPNLISSDARSQMLNFLRNSNTNLCMLMIYPALYEIHTIMSTKAGLPIIVNSEDQSLENRSGQILLPKCISLTSEKLIRQGVYLMDCGTVFYLWISREAHPMLVLDLFGESYESLRSGKCEIPVLEKEVNVRLRNVIAKLRDNEFRKFVYPPLYVVKEEGGIPILKMKFLNNLVEDKQEFGPSYVTYLGELREKLQK